MHRILFIVGVLLLGMSRVAVAQDDGPRVVKLTVSPAPASASPMPHQLLPHLRDIKSGNAAVFYQRSQSIEWWGASVRKEINKQIETLETPWAPESAKSQEWLQNYGVLKEIDLAARCESCDWQLLDRLRTDSYLLLLPDLQSFRTVSALNAVRIRSDIHRGEFEKAARGLQTSFAMAKHVGESPSLIGYMVGIAMTNVAKDRVAEWVAQPDAPSLFWALTDLPHPLIDWRRALQAESVMTEALFPEIRQALQEKKPRPIPLETLQDRIKKLVETSNIRFDPIQWSFAMAETEPRARAFFAKRGLAPEEIDRLPVLQLVLMYLLTQHELRSDEFTSVQNLPYWQARPFLKKWRDRRELPNPGMFGSFLWTMLPSDHIFGMGPRMEREFTLLRHVEALRLYAALHQGRWPDSLDDLRELPLPVDPFTGKGFTYRHENKTAILEAFAPPGMIPNEANWIRYELTIRTK